MKNQPNNHAAVLMNAFNKAGSELSLTIADKAKIVGIHSSTFSHNLAKGYSPYSKIGELQLHFIQLYKALYQLSSGDKALMQHWFYCDNKALNGSPRVLCQSIQGLIRTTQYLQSLKSKTLVG